MNLTHIQTFLFDLDGTLTKPVLDFDDMRRRLSLPDGVSISHEILKMTGQRKADADRIIEKIEIEAAQKTKPNTGALELMDWLHDNELKVGIITRNHLQAAQITLKILNLPVDVLVSRHCAPPKPAPEPLQLALQRLEGNAASTLMTGDFLDDLIAGKNAGTYTCLLTNGDPESNWPADLTITTLSELHAMLNV